MDYLDGSAPLRFVKAVWKSYSCISLLVEVTAV